MRKPETGNNLCFCIWRHGRQPWLCLWKYKCIWNNTRGYDLFPYIVILCGLQGIRETMVTYPRFTVKDESKHFHRLSSLNIFKILKFFRDFQSETWIPKKMYTPGPLFIQIANLRTIIGRPVTVRQLCIATMCAMPILSHRTQNVNVLWVELAIFPPQGRLEGSRTVPEALS